MKKLSVVVVVYELSTAARQEARQWSAEVDIVFPAQHMEAVQTKKRLRIGVHREICEEVSRGPRHISNQYGEWSPSWTDKRERTALAQNAKHGRRVRLAGSQNMY